MQHNEKKKTGVIPPRTLIVLSIVAGGASLLLFWLTLSPSAFPGESASLMAVRLGIEPRLTPAYPIWHACTAVWLHLPLNAAVYALNLWSALCGALAVGLLCRYLTVWIDTRIVLDKELTDRQAGPAALVAGGAAALALATSIPFWAAATRLHVLAFHTVLLLLAFNLAQDYRIKGQGWRPYALALLCGAGCVETALFLVMTPYFATVLLLAMYRRREIPWRRLLGLTLTGLGGAGLCGAAAWLFSGSDGFAPRGYAGCFAVVVQTLLGQLRQLQLMFPRVGWIAVVVFAIVPWLAVQFEARHGLNRRRELVVMLFHVILVVIALLVQSNASLLPWSGSLPAGRLPVLELLLNAMVIGYLAAFWFLRFMDPELRAGAREKRSSKGSSKDDERLLIRGLAGVMGGALILFTVLAVFPNGACASGRRASFTDAYVSAILDQLQGRTWLVTDGLLDSKLKITALGRGQKLHLVDLSADRHPIQVRRLRRAITDDPVFADHVAGYRNAANLGGSAFLQEWLASDTGAVSRIAFYTSPDLLIEAGLTPRADRLLFKGEKDTAPLKDLPFIAEHEPFWLDMERLLKGETQGDPINLLRGAVRRHVSMTANNLGVLLEDLGRPEDAYAAYRRALAIDPGNFSAMLNRVVLTRQGIQADDKNQAESDAAKALDKLKKLPDAGRMARFYGYVRVPAEFSRQSAEWMRFGQPKMATAVLRRAMDLAPEDQRRQFLQGLAAIQLADGKPEKSESLFQSILKKTPLDTSALLGMVRVSLAKQDIPAARAWLEQVRLAGAADELLAIEESTIDIAAGDFEKAQRRLQALTDRTPRHLQAWALRANLLISQGKASDVERDILPHMKAAAGNTPQYLTALTEGYVLRSKGPAFFKAARESFLAALGMQPGTRVLITEVLKIDYALQDQAAAEIHAATLLRLDRDDVLANYVMGSILIAKNDLEGAEAYLRRCVTTAPTSMLWNDLAETQRMRGKLAEAESAVRQALALDPKNPFAHDTLACIMIDAGRLAEAWQASVAARTLDPDTVSFKLTEVRILARTGDPIEVRERVRQLAQQADRLSPRQRADLAAVSTELKRR